MRKELIQGTIILTSLTMVPERNVSPYLCDSVAPIVRNSLTTEQRADNALNNQSAFDEIIIRAYVDPWLHRLNEPILDIVSQKEAAEIITKYTSRIESNISLKNMADRYETKVLPALNKFNENTLLPEDFVNNAVPVFCRITDSVIYSAESKNEDKPYQIGGGWGGSGLSGTAIVFGPFDEPLEESQWGDFIQIVTHEAFLHSKLQTATDLEWNEDAELIHPFMGTGETVAWLAGGITDQVPNLLIIAWDRMERGGLDPKDIIVISSRIESGNIKLIPEAKEAYNRGKYDEDPTFEELLLEGKLPSVLPANAQIDKYRSILAEFAQIPNLP